MQCEWPVLEIDLKGDQDKQQDHVGLYFQAKGHQEDLNAHNQDFPIHDVDLPKVCPIPESIVQEAELLLNLDVVEVVLVCPHVHEPVKRDTDY